MWLALAAAVQTQEAFASTNKQLSGYYELQQANTTNLIRIHFSEQRTGEDRHGTWFEDHTFPFLVRQAFTSNQSGVLRLKIDRGNGDSPENYSSKGLCEALYAIGILIPQNRRDEWQERLLPKTRSAVRLGAVQPDHKLDYETLTTVPDNERKEIVKLASDVYDRYRPELFRTFPGGLLFYPPSREGGWQVFRDGNSLVAVTGCFDLMFAAEFRLRFDRTTNGKWNCREILGRRWFKGE